MTHPDIVVLVEGESDRVALERLAARVGRDLAAEGVAVVAMHGITNTRTFALRFGPRGRGLRLAGLYDAPEERLVRQELAAAGLPEALEPGGLARLGFFGCHADLEDELIRTLGADRAEAVIEAAGEGASLRRLAQRPAQRGGRGSACCGGSSAPSRGGRRGTRRCSSTRWSPAASRRRSPRGSRPCDRRCASGEPGSAPSRGGS